MSVVARQATVPIPSHIVWVRNSPHGDPVAVSEVTEDAERTIVSPRSEKQTTIPTSAKNGADRTGLAFDDAVVVRRAVAGRVWALVPGGVRVPVRGFGTGRVAARLTGAFRDVLVVRVM